MNNPDMSNLSQENIEFITQTINQSAIKSTEMKEDLIDHFCCAIEEEMKKGLSFEKSYEKAYRNICPEGLVDIQHETVFLLTFKKIKAMKRLLYLSGYLTAIGVTTTFALKMTHTAGAAIAFFVSFILLMFLFLPSLFMNLYKREISKTFTNKLMYLLAFTGLLFLVTSVLFKIMHWPLGSFLLFTSVAIINFALFPLLFYKMYRKA